jgi:hypothetical protein
MNSGERMLAAIRGEPVDRMPFSTYNCHGFGWGSHAREAAYRPILDAIARTGAGVLCKVSAVASGGLPAPEITETLEGGDRVTTAVLRTPAGALRRVLRKPPGQPARHTEPYIKTDRDIERFASLEAEPLRWDVRELLKRCKEIGAAGVAYLDYDDPLASAVGLFEQEDVLIRLHTDPGPVLDLMERAFKRIRQGLLALLEVLPRGGNICFYTCGPEYATPPLMPPALFGRLVTPYHRELVGLIHEYGFPASMHCHGRVRQAIGEVLRCGFDVLEPVEPPPQGDIDLAGLRAAAGEKLALMGYVQDQDLHTATPERIRSHVAGIVEVIGRGSRFIATPTCTPFQFPPTEQYVANYVAQLEAAAELGA